MLYDAAESGVAEARNWINTHPNQQPFRSADSGEIALENNVQVNDALGNPIPGMYRTTWIGKSGSRTGEYGIFGAAISQVTDGVGNTVVHRATIYQDTFAKYAYFSNSEAGIYFGGGDQIFGPAHSNDNIRIAASGVEFHNQLTTSKTIVTGLAFGIFDQGYQQHVPVITPAERELADVAQRSRDRRPIRDSDRERNGRQRGSVDDPHRVRACGSQQRR